MSNRPSAPHTDRPASSTDRPTATYPTGYPAYRPASYPAGWQADPAGYVHEGDPRLAQADAAPTGVFPTNRSARTCARYHTPQTDPQSVQDLWRPGPLSRPSMRWHPSLMQLAIGAALVAALLGACNVAAIQAHRTARAYCHALVTQDWDRAQRECRGTGSGTPTPEQTPSSPHTPSPAPSQAPSPSTPPAFTRVNSPSPSTQPPSSPQGAPAWVTRDTGAPYDRTDPHSTPLDLPRCTTSPSTPLPCLASLSSDGSRAVVLEEDASLTGLVRR